MGRGSLLGLVLVCALLGLSSGLLQRNQDERVQGMSDGGADFESEMMGFGATGELRDVTTGDRDRWSYGDNPVAVEASEPEEPPAGDEPPPPLGKLGERSCIWWDILKWVLTVVLVLLAIVTIIFWCYHLLSFGKQWRQFGKHKTGYGSDNPDPTPLVNTRDRSA